MHELDINVVTGKLEYKWFSTSNGLFTLLDPDSDPYLNSDSCTMQKFHIGLDPDSDPLIEMYGIGTDICP